MLTLFQKSGTDLLHEFGVTVPISFKLFSKSSCIAIAMPVTIKSKDTNEIIQELIWFIIILFWFLDTNHSHTRIELTEFDVPDGAAISSAEYAVNSYSDSVWVGRTLRTRPCGDVSYVELTSSSSAQSARCVELTTRDELERWLLNTFLLCVPYGTWLYNTYTYVYQIP